MTDGEAVSHSRAELTSYHCVRRIGRVCSLSYEDDMIAVAAGPVSGM